MYLIKNSPVLMVVGSIFFFFLAIGYWTYFSGTVSDIGNTSFYRSASRLIAFFFAPTVALIMAEITFSAFWNFEKIFAEYSTLPSFRRFYLPEKKYYLLLLFVSQIAVPAVPLYYALINLF